MKILAVSDKVLEKLYQEDVASEYRDIELILGCGDLPYYYLEFLASALDACLFYVHGNHDRGPQYTIDGRVLTGVQGGRNIHARVAHQDDLLIAGLEGSMRYRPMAPFMYTEWEMTLQVARLLPQLLWNRQRHGRFLDILVTHSPPFGIQDQPDLAHTGFRIFRWLLTYFRPQYMLHGHVHLYRNDLPRVTRFSQTLVINVYPFYLLDLVIPPEAEAVIPVK